MNRFQVDSFVTQTVSGFSVHLHSFILSARLAYTFNIAYKVKYVCLLFY